MITTTAAGFEPARAEPNAFRVHLLNHSDTLSHPQVGAVNGEYIFKNSAILRVPKKVLPRFELGLPDSESGVITVTPQDR